MPERVIINKKTAVFLLKIFLVIFIFYFIARMIDINRLKQSFKEIDLPVYALVILLNFLLDGFLIIQLKLILSGLGVRRSFLNLLSITYAGYLYGFLGEINAIAVRWHRIAGHDKRRGESFLALVITRIQLVMALYFFLVLSFAAKEARYFSAPERHSVIVLIAIIGALIALFIALFTNGAWVGFLNAKLSRARPVPLWLRFIVEKTLDILRVIEVFRKYRKIFLLALGFCLAYTCTVVYLRILLVKCVGVSVSFLDGAWITAFSQLALMVPITIYGLGVNEGIGIYLLGKYGVSPEQALTYGLLGFSLCIVKAVTGGIIELIKGWRLARR